MPLGVSNISLGVGRVGSSASTSPPGLGADDLAYPSGTPASGTNYVISSTPVLHFDAYRITGLSDGDACDEWEDRSGNGYDATQTSSSNQPTYRSSGQNSRPYLEWDGGDLMDIATGGSVSDDFTLVVVGKRASTSSSYIPISTDSTTYNYYWGYYTSLGLYEFAAFSVTGFSNDLTSFDFAWQMRDSSDVLKMYERDGGTELDSRTWSAVSTLDYKHLGTRKSGSIRTDGDIYEVILWDSQLSTSELNVVLDQLDNKYQLTSGGNSHTDF